MAVGLLQDFLLGCQALDRTERQLGAAAEIDGHGLGPASAQPSMMAGWVCRACSGRSRGSNGPHMRGGGV